MTIHDDVPFRDGELELLAARYVGGELSPPEAEAFEERLAEDHDARLAVEFAVRVAGSAVLTSVQATDIPAVRVASSRLRRIAAAAVVFVSLGLGVHFAASDGWLRGDSGATPTEAQDLISSWIDFGDLAADGDVEGASLDAEFEGSDEIAGFDAGETPDWMIQGLKDD